MEGAIIPRRGRRSEIGREDSRRSTSVSVYAPAMPGTPDARLTRARQPPAVTAFVIAVTGLAVLALLAPFGDAEHPLKRVGVLLAFGGVLEVLHGMRRASTASLRRAAMSGAFSLVMGLLVMSAISLAGGALVLLLAITFAMDGLGYLGAARRSAGRAAAPGVARRGGRSGGGRRPRRRATSGSRRPGSSRSPPHCACSASPGRWRSRPCIRPAMRPRPSSTTWVSPIIRKPPVCSRRSPSRRRCASVPIAGWVAAFIVTLFAIHVARQEPDGTMFGYAAPAIAVAGDMALAVIVAFVVGVPLTFSRVNSTRWLERMVWRWYLSAGEPRRGLRYRLATVWLRYRLRMAMRLREARFSIPAALWRSLAAGLPVAAVIAATVPVWGMSWFFDTENWATGIWNSWAEARTDRWREAMVHAVTGPAGAGPITFAVTPPGAQSGDFSFVVIGDTGEGDASQHALRDQLLTVAGHEDVRFVVLSSDVVYPNGSMIDYETNFWLPFKGVTKPVYAIPGNHDWYDALEAFNATFLEPGAARAAIRARAEADLRLSSTTNARIDGLLGQAARLRGEYQVPTGFQRGTVLRDPVRSLRAGRDRHGHHEADRRGAMEWLEAALDRARGKSIMAVLGHPFYAKSYDMAYGNEPFARLKRLLVDRGVTIMMAGDTHDLEYYVEPPGASTPALHYFVNGGGGAFLSLGTSLEWPAKPPTAEWAFYPTRDDIVRKIDRETPWWKRPAWWWVSRQHAWPFQTEYLSGLFDYNVAPFFQSFIEVRVERRRAASACWPTASTAGCGGAICHARPS